MNTSSLQTTDIDELRHIALASWQRAQALEVEAQRQTAEAQRLAGEVSKLEAKVAAQGDELDVLLKRIQELTEELARERDTDRQLALELELKVLRERLTVHAKETFASTSERRPRGDGAAKDDKKKDKAKQPGHGPTPQPELPIEQVVHHLDAPDCTCPACGGGLREMKGQFEESILVAVIERTYRLEHHRRQKYNCACGHIDTALGPDKLIPGGRYDLSFTMQVALDKYLDHLPLDRQVRRMKRAGLKVTSQTLWDQLAALYNVLLPTYEAHKAMVRREAILHLDETTWRMMKPSSGSKKWWMWIVASTAGMFVEILPSRSNAAAKKVLQGFSGTVVADGYGVYGSLEKALFKAGGQQVALDGSELPIPDFDLAICWMHARRPLFKAENNAPEVTEVLDLIGALYEVEARARQEANGDRDKLLQIRRRLRQDESRDLVSRIELWADSQHPLPKTYYGKGVAFLRNYRRGLRRFLDDPGVELDNGEAERGLRGPVLGRKNHYGSRSELGARVAELMYSLLQSCVTAGANPRDWLAAAAAKALAEPGAVLLPSDFAAAQSGD